MGMIKSFYSIKILRIALGLFFIALGIAGISSKIDESIFRLSSHQPTIEIIFGLIEVICGILLLIGLMLDYKSVYIASIIVFIFWIIRIVLTRFVWGLNFINSKGVININTFFSWFLIFSCELLICACIWVVMQRYE